jgi:hypothetical protein
MGRVVVRSAAVFLLAVQWASGQTTPSIAPQPWLEVYYCFNPSLHTHWGFGIDEPIDRDLADGQIRKNQTAFANRIWDITLQSARASNFSWRKTDYVVLNDNQGFGVQTQTQCSF